MEHARPEVPEGGGVKSMDIWRAAACNDLFSVRLLLESGLDVNTRNAYGQTALHSASWHGFVDVMRFLIDRHADVNAVDYDGQTPLHWASGSGFVDAVDLLVLRGADINQPDNDEQVPLHWAATNGQSDVVVHLLRMGASPNLPNVEGHTPADVAKTQNIRDIIVLNCRQSVSPGTTQAIMDALPKYSPFGPSSEPEMLHKDIANQQISAPLPPPPDPPKSNLERQHTDSPLLYDDFENLSLSGYEWEIDDDELAIGKSIGIGGFGEVYQATWRGLNVAVKKLVNTRMTEKDMRNFRAEVSMMSKLRHPNILLFLGASVRMPHLFVVTEHCERGALYDVLHDTAIHLSPTTMVNMSIDICRGINYLHCTRKPHPIIHRDIKSLNLLVNKHWVIKVADFGHTKFKVSTLPMSQCGTPQWMAPEVLRNESYNEKADIFSVGIVFWELLTRKVPYEEFHPMQVVGMVAYQNPGLRPPMPENSKPNLVPIIRQCLQELPAARPMCGDILRYLEALKV